MFIIECVLFTLLSVLAYFYYSYVYRPKKIYDYYSHTLQLRGFKVLQFPFQPFQVPFKNRYQQSYLQHKDAFYLDKNIKQTYDIVLHNIADLVVLDLVNPDMIKDFLSLQKIFIFPKKKILIANLQRLLGHGVTFSEGQVWKSKRKIVTSIFTFDFLKSIIPNISAICDSEFEKMQKQWMTQNPSSFEFKAYMLQMGFNIFSNVMIVSFFGMDINKCKIDGRLPAQVITEALRLANEQSTQPIGYLFGTWIFGLGLRKKDRKVNQIVKSFRNFATNLIKEKIETAKIYQKQAIKKECDDLIEAMVKYYHLGDQKQSSGQKYSIEDVIDEFCTLFAAGTDTTSHFFMMLVYYIVSTPQVQARLRKQIELVFKTQDDFTYNNLKKMKYIQCIQQEVNRIYGPTNGVFLREAIKDTNIFGVPIKKNTGVSVKPMLNHYNNEYFEDPLSFKPQRWQKKNNLHPYILWNFSAGPRSCLGKHLALLQTKICLIKLFKRYKQIKLEKNIQGWEMQFMFLYAPQKFMTILKREN